MIYKDFQGLKLSALGMGCMRLPRNSASDADVNEAETARMVACAMERGVNYYDTAWGYHEGNSETVMGRVLAKYPRESFYLATKFPGYDLANMPKVKEIFPRQLEKCGVDYFDFYLIHNVCEMNIDAYLDPQYGIMDYLLEQKAQGRIRHLGFSAHGSYEVMKRFLDAYGEHMEFCQIQLNYVDWAFQDAKGKVELLKAHHLPVWVMEPLRGGKLASLAEEDAAALKALRPEETVPAWAFRFLQSVPGVTVVLSGMGSVEQVEDNLATWSEDRPLNEREFAALTEIGRNLFAKGTVPCTACHYCVSKCPQGLDIPRLLRLYNEAVYSGVPAVSGTIKEISPDKQPGACISCHSCAAVCPQNIEIPETLAKFTEMLGTKE